MSEYIGKKERGRRGGQGGGGEGKWRRREGELKEWRTKEGNLREGKATKKEEQ